MIRLFNKAGGNNHTLNFIGNTFVLHVTYDSLSLCNYVRTEINHEYATLLYNYQCVISADSSLQAQQ
jgi:hypothetical protein